MASGFQTAPSRFQIQSFDAELVAVQLDARGLDGLDGARALLASIRDELSRLRREKLVLTGERADATGNLIDAGQAFVDGAAARLMAKAEAGDADALARLTRAATRILAVLRGETPTADAIANVGQLAQDVAQDTRAAAAGAGSALPWIFGIVALGVVVYAWTQRAALSAALRG